MASETEKELQHWKEMQAEANKLFSWAQNICESLRTPKATPYDIQLFGDPKLLHQADLLRDRLIEIEIEIADKISNLEKRL